jgi:asparagine synthase (glutamine-hydrolysing)
MYNLKKFHRNYEELESKLIESIKKQTKHVNDFAILFSGGVDSTFLAKICQEIGKKFTCFSCGTPNSEDIIYSKKIAKDFGFDLEIRDLKLTEDVILEVLKIIKEPDVMKLSVAIPFYLATKNTGKKVCFSGLGSEEIFAGYERHISSHPIEIHRKCVEGLFSMWKRDLYRDNCITMFNGLELRVPYLSLDVVECALKFDPKFRIHNGIKKYNFRKIAEKYIGEYAWRKKRAAQYGSGVMKQLEKLTKRKGFKYKKDYILKLWESIQF